MRDAGCGFGVVGFQGRPPGSLNDLGFRDCDQYDGAGYIYLDIFPCGGSVDCEDRMENILGYGVYSSCIFIIFLSDHLGKATGGSRLEPIRTLSLLCHTHGKSHRQLTGPVAFFDLLRDHPRAFVWLP